MVLGSLSRVLHLPEPIRRWFLEENDQCDYLNDRFSDAKQPSNGICCQTLRQFKNPKRHAYDEQNEVGDASPILPLSNHVDKEPNDAENGEHDEHNEGHGRNLRKLRKLHDEYQDADAKVDVEKCYRLPDLVWSAQLALVHGLVSPHAA